MVYHSDVPAPAQSLKPAVASPARPGQAVAEVTASEGLWLVFGSPVSQPEKDRDWTGPRPIRTANSQDRKRLKTARARHGFANPRGCPGMGSPGTGTG